MSNTLDEIGGGERSIETRAGHPPTGLSDRVAGDVFPGAVNEFVSAHGLQAHLKAAERIARQTFRPETQLTVRLAQFPDFDEARLVVGVTALSTVENLLSCYDQFLDRWIEQVPTNAREKIRVVIAST